MEHSKNYEKILGYYRQGFWNAERVWKAVGKQITPEEYTEITGEEYTTE